MWLLSAGGTAPIELSITFNGGVLTWNAEIGQIDAQWMRLSVSKRWNAVYLYASGSADEPPWNTSRRYNGEIN